MRVLIATSEPERYAEWIPALEAHGLRACAVTTDRRDLGRSPGEAPEVVLVHVAAGAGDLREIRTILARLYPGAPIGLIALASRRILPTLAEEEIDDVLSLPASLDEVVYRVLRVAQQVRRLPPSIQVGGLTIRPLEGQVLLEGQRVPLRLREFELLRFLASHPNRVFRRNELLQAVWNSGFEGSTRTVDVHITRLRRSLGRYGQQHIQTVRGVGYRFAVPR